MSRQALVSLLLIAAFALTVTACAQNNQSRSTAAAGTTTDQGAADRSAAAAESQKQSTLQSTFRETRPTADAAQYRRVCGICHLDEGEGVPAAFPPLDERLTGWARTQAGRTYLVGVISNGLFGPIEVGGQRYNGAMPPMGGSLAAPEIAGLLNYVLTEFAAAPSNLLFTATEIAETMDTIGTATGASLRP